MTVRLSYIVWRDGRPRFVPPGHVRKLGFKGEDLRHGPAGKGPWFTYEEAKTWADSRLAAINKARDGMKPAKVSATASAGATVGELLDDWINSDSVRRTRPATRRSYRASVAAMKYKPRERSTRNPVYSEDDREAFSLLPVVGVREPELNKFLEYIIRVRGLAMAHAVGMAFSVAYNWASLEPKWRLARDKNPRTKLRLPPLEGRISVITPKEFVALVEAADRLGHHSIGDSLYLGLYTGQRQGDRRAMCEDFLEDGYLKIRQKKTGEVVRILAPSPLTARLKEAAKRRRELMLRMGTRHPHLLLNETTGNPWDASSYRRNFRDVRAEAAKAIPSAAKRTDQDLRDTAVTMLHRAGADIITICDVTGHTYDSVNLIIKHYLGRDPKRAGVALERMADFIEAELA